MGAVVGSSRWPCRNKIDRWTQRVNQPGTGHSRVENIAERGKR